jgi:hypothetical protein
MDAYGEEKKTSPWVYVGIGCAIPVLLIAILFGATLFWGWRMAKQVTTENPVERAERVKQVLGAQTIPEGYYPALSLSIPFLMDLAILGDRPVDFSAKDDTKEGKEKRKPFDKQGFIFVNAIRGNRGRTIRDYIDGKADASEILQAGNVRLGDPEEIGRGSFPLADDAGHTAHFITNRGTVMAEGQRVKGLATLLYFDCGDKRFRLGIWFGPDPTAGGPIGAPAAYAGTQADESAIKEFVAHFAPCGS